MNKQNKKKNEMSSDMRSVPGLKLIDVKLLYRHDEGRSAHRRIKESTSSSLSGGFSQLFTARRSYWFQYVDVGQLGADRHHVTCYWQQDHSATTNAWRCSSIFFCSNFDRLHVLPRRTNLMPLRKPVMCLFVLRLECLIEAEWMQLDDNNLSL